MAWFGRSVRRFTAAESFQLFMEGLRSLQFYDEAAEQTDPVEEATLTQLLCDAEKFFQDGVDSYPKDILPRYYLAIVLSIRGQVGQARAVRSQIDTGRSVTATSNDADDLFLCAAEMFDKIADDAGSGHGGGDLMVYAQYNQAQALAKMQNGPANPWDQALKILQTIDPELALTNLSWWDRQVGQVRFLLLRFGISSFAESLPAQIRSSAQDVSAGVSLPLKAKKGETRAFELQVRVLEYAIQLRKAVLTMPEFQLKSLPQDQREEELRAQRARQAASGEPSATKKDSAADPLPPGSENTIRTFIAEIRKDDKIPASAADDIIADYWSKLAFIAWEKAAVLNEKPGGPWLTQARNYINIALMGRPNWTPGQLNLARIQALEGKKNDALQTLARVLGKPQQTAQAAMPATSGPNPSDIAATISKMATERNPQATAGVIQQIYGSLTQDTIKRVTESLAGKVDGELLFAILLKLQSTTRT